MIPNGWQHCVLPDFANIVMGQSPPSSTYNHSGDGLPFFQGKAEFGDLYPTVNMYCTRPNKVAKQNATLLSVRAPVGPTNLAQQDCCIGRGLAAIHPCGGITPKFLLYLFRSIEPEISGKGTGSTFKAITKSFVESLDFGLPPLPEQHRIVAKIEELFSELDKGIESLKAARAKLDVYRQAVLKPRLRRQAHRLSGEKRTKTSLRRPRDCCLASRRNAKHVTKGNFRNGRTPSRNGKGWGETERDLLDRESPRM